MTDKIFRFSLCLMFAACSDDPSPGELVDAGADDRSDAALADVTSATPDDGPTTDTRDDAATLDAAGDDDDFATPDDFGFADLATTPDASDDTGEPGVMAIYLAPDGDDARDGGTLERAIATLERAHELVEAAGPRDVEIRITDGTYYAQSVRWTATSPDHQISFTRWPRDAETRPIFDGCNSASGPCPGGTWFQVPKSDGLPTNLEFYYVQVQNYQTAISLNGGRNAESQSNGGNRIYGCMFRDIGNEYNPSLSPSTAAVRLVNSDDNSIENNHFVNVVNTTSGALIHAIYVAHMSDRNQILRNRFKRSTGDPVRVRDFSNDNVINDNRFIQVGTAAGYTDWYCDHDVRDDCTKVDPECPSWGNQFRDNLLDGKWDCTPLGTFHYFQDDSTTGCAPPSASARRLRTSGNQQHTPPCTSE